MPSAIPTLSVSTDTVSAVQDGTETAMNASEVRQVIIYVRIYSVSGVCVPFFSGHTGLFSFSGF